MKYSDSHIDLISLPEDLKSLSNFEIIGGQVSPVAISKLEPELVFLSVFVEPSSDIWKKILKLTKKYHEIIQKENWILVLSKKDLTKPGIKVVLHLENLLGIGSDLGRIDKLFQMGFRSIGLTHNQTNQFAGGAMDTEGGLSALGLKAVEKIIRQGMVLDLAHLNEQSATDIMQSFAVLPFISHSGVRSVFPNVRNTSNQMLNIIKKRSGYIGICFAGSMVGSKNAKPDDVKAHFDAAIKMAGQNNVGIGSDFGGIISFLCKGLESIKKVDCLELFIDKNVFGQNLISFLKRSNLIDR